MRFVLLVVGLIGVVLGCRRAWGHPRRPDEERWRWFLLALVALVAVVAALAPTH